MGSEVEYQPNEDEEKESSDGDSLNLTGSEATPTKKPSKGVRGHGRGGPAVRGGGTRRLAARGGGGKGKGKRSMHEANSDVDAAKSVSHILLLFTRRLLDSEYEPFVSALKKQKGPGIGGLVKDWRTISQGSRSRSIAASGDANQSRASSIAPYTFTDDSDALVLGTASEDYSMSDGLEAGRSVSGGGFLERRFGFMILYYVGERGETKVSMNGTGSWR